MALSLENREVIVLLVSGRKGLRNRNCADLLADAEILALHWPSNTQLFHPELESRAVYTEARSRT